MRAYSEEPGAPHCQGQGRKRAHTPLATVVPLALRWGSWSWAEVPGVPVGNALVSFQHAIVLGQASSHISKQGDVQGAQASLLPWSVDPVGERVRVGALGCPAQQNSPPRASSVIRAEWGYWQQ